MCKYVSTNFNTDVCILVHMLIFMYVCTCMYMYVHVCWFVYIIIPAKLDHY